MRNFNGVSRVVVKVGTNILSLGGVPDDGRIESLSQETSKLMKMGISVIIISSGAIGFGSKILGIGKRPRKMEMRQACAAVGQPELMDRWRLSLEKMNLKAAQILLSRETFDDRQAYLNLRNAVEALLSLGVVPILNENDSVSTAEIGDVFGDNDSLSAQVASKLEAGLLVLLTDIDAFYDKDPRNYPDAKPLKIVETLTDEVLLMAGDAGTEHSTGGMITKLKAVEVACRSGCRTVLADGREPKILQRIISGEDVGTLFLTGRKLGARARWILGARPKGVIRVDQGALKALENKKSLLPKGVVHVDGVFDVGDVVDIETDFRAVVSMGSEDIKKVKGRHSREVESLLGESTGGRREEVARVDDIVSLKPKG